MNATMMQTTPIAMQRIVISTARPSAVSGLSRPLPIRSSRSRFAVRASKQENLDNDSYAKIEAPVRGGEGAEGRIPDGGPPIRERENELDREIVASQGNKERDILGTEVSIADSFRFKGAAPEVINCRLAMLGFVAAVGSELATGRTVSQQVAFAPLAVAGTFLLFIVATMIPILKGVPRKGAAEWGGIPQFTSDAELINGRVAMIGFAGLVLTETILGHAVF